MTRRTRKKGNKKEKKDGGGKKERAAKKEKKKRQRESEDERGDDSSAEGPRPVNPGTPKIGRLDEATQHDSESEVYYMSRVCIFGYTIKKSVGVRFI